MRTLLLFLLPLLLSLGLTAQSINLVSITNNCNSFRFCATGVPAGTVAIDWRMNGMNTPRQFNTNCVTLPGPFNTIQAFFLRQTVTPFGTFYGPNGNTPLISRPNIGPVTISGGSGYQGVCQSTNTTITLTAASCVRTSSWSITGVTPLYEQIPGADAITASIAGFSSGITSTARLRIQASSSWRVNTSYSIGIRAVDNLGNVSTRTYVAYTTSGCWGREATEEEVSVLEDGSISETGVPDPATQSEVRAIIADLQLSDSERSATSLRVYPNPARNQLNINYSTTPTTLRLVSLDGREVVRTAGSQLAAERTQLDVSQLPTGLYLLEATDRYGERTVRKVQINR